MPKNNLPTYAIVELLIRLAQFDRSIGDYKNHSVYDEGVVVKTTGGIIRFPQALIMQQFESPESITDNILAGTLSSFSPVK